MMASSSNSPCAACKFLRRKCQPDCLFAPYFPPDLPQRFMNVHKVYGASNVAKLLNDLHPHQREDAVNSLAYEADMRLRDPVFGCVGVIAVLEHQLHQLRMDLSFAQSELYKCQSLAIINHGLVAAAKATYHHHHQQHHNTSTGINLHHGGVGDQFYHHQYIQRDEPAVVRDPNSLNGMNGSVASNGQSSKFQHSTAVAGDGHSMPTEPF